MATTRAPPPSGMSTMPGPGGGGASQTTPYTALDDREQQVLREVGNGRDVITVSTERPHTLDDVSASGTRALWRCVRWTCGLLFIIVALGVVVAAAEGMFSHVKRHAEPRPGNSTVTEPNTHERFPMDLHGGQRVLGLTLWTLDNKLGLHVHVAAVALYVNRDVGQRRLHRFKARTNKDNFDTDLENALVAPGMMETMRFKMVGSMPRAAFLRNWVDDVRPFLFESCGGSEDLVKTQIDALRKAFETVGFHKGDDFSLERRALDDALFLYHGAFDPNRGTERSRVGTSSCLTRAVFREKLQRLRSGLTNMLEELWGS